MAYRDRWIECGDDAVVVRGYYFPWGSRHIPYAEMRRVVRAPMNVLNGKMRIWGTANPRYWASLDPQRARKSTAFIIDTGRPIKAFLTPDDADGFATALRAHDIDVDTAPTSQLRPRLL